MTFGGLKGFDAHRRGGVCASPAVLGFVERSGVWRAPIGEVRLAQLAALRVTPRAVEPRTAGLDTRVRVGPEIADLPSACGGLW